MLRALKSKACQVGNAYLHLWRDLKGWKLFLFYLLHYTLLFLALQHFIFAMFAQAGKSLVRLSDGSSQHFVRLMYLSRTMRRSIQSLLSGNGWTFPMYDFHNALAVQDTQYGFPELFAMLWPWDRIDRFYSLYVISNYYLIGLSFSIFGFYFRQKPLPVLIGSIGYAFCGFAVIAGVRHPFFSLPMIYLPLLIVGTEKVLHREASFLLTATVFLSLTSHFGVYFSCMQAIFVFVYACVRFFSLYRESRPREFLCLFGRLCAWGGTGVLLSLFTALPTLCTILSSGRVGNEIWAHYDALAYPASYYQNFFSRFIVISNDAGYWTCLGFSVLTLPAVLLMYIRRRREMRDLRVIFAILTVMLIIPAVAYVMSGFSNISNRFCFCYAFCVAAILMFMLPELERLDRSGAFMLAAALLVYALVCRFVIDERYYQQAPISLLLLAGLALLCCRGKRTKRVFMPVCLAITCFSVCYTAYLKCDPSQGNYVADFVGNPYDAIQDGQYSSLRLSRAVSEDDSFFRVTGNSIIATEPNAAFRYDLNGLSSYPYYGLNQNYIEWIVGQEVQRDGASNQLYVRDTRAALLTLSGVKYYASRKTDHEIWPYGFEPIDRVENSLYPDDILINEHWLPIGYTYSQYLSRERYEQLDALGKQEAQLQAVVLDDKPLLSSISEADIKTTAQRIPCNVLATDGLTWEDNVLRVSKEGATLTVVFDGIPQTQTYLRIVNLDLTSGTSSRDFLLTARADDRVSKAYFVADAATYAHGQHTQMLDLGYTEDGCTEITVVFPSKGTFILDGIEVWCQPMGDYAAQVKALGEETLQNVQTSWRGLTGEIRVSTDKMLCVAIPYMDGWTAFVDGERVPLYRANTAFMALELAAGEHSVELRYWMPGLSAGLALSGLGVLCLAALSVWNRKRRNAWHRLQA